MTKELKALIPEYGFDHLKDLSSTAELRELGAFNINSLIEHWQYSLDEAKEAVSNKTSLLKFIINKSSSSITRLAKRYENPSVKIGHVDDSKMCHGAEPVDDASLARKSGASSFNICGWCKHAYCGVVRYNYHISTSCEFEVESGLREGKKFFNTKCFLRTAPPEKFKQLALGLKKELVLTKQIVQNIKKNLRVLQKLKKEAKILEKNQKKPVMPSSRPADWFNVDDKVIVYLGGWKDSKCKLLVRELFIAGIVVRGYRHHDGCVTTKLGTKIHTNENNYDGHGFGSGVESPIVMHKWEYDYLLKHREFAKRWIQGSSFKNESSEVDKFIAAIELYAKKATATNVLTNVKGGDQSISSEVVLV